MSSFRKYMDRCQELATLASEQGESPVGAMVVKEGTIITEATEATRRKGDITRHAEIEVIAKATDVLGKDLSGCTLITTHEPCVMCSYVIRFHGLSEVVYGQPSDYLGGITSPFAVLTTDQIPDHWSNPPKIYQLTK